MTVTLRSRNGGGIHLPEFGLHFATSDRLEVEADVARTICATWPQMFEIVTTAAPDQPASPAAAPAEE